MTSQYDLFSGSYLRDTGIALVTENAGDWMDNAKSLVSMFLARHPGRLITGDDIREVVQPRLGPPHHPNAWGALTRSMLVRGRLIPTGRLVKSTRATNHAHANPEYEIAA